MPFGKGRDQGLNIGNGNLRDDDNPRVPRHRDNLPCRALRFTAPAPPPADPRLLKHPEVAGVVGDDGLSCLACMGEDAHVSPP